MTQIQVMMGVELRALGTKQAVEVDSSQALSPMDQVAECPDNTGAQLIHSNSEYSDCNEEHLTVAREGHVQKLPETVGNEKIVHRNVVPKSEKHVEGQQSNPTGRELEASRDVGNQLDISNNVTVDSKEPTLELSLKKLRGDQDTHRSVQEERNVLHRSEQSAFSRYNTSTNIFKPPNAITGSSYVLHNSMEAAKRESVGDIQVFSTDHVMYQPFAFGPVKTELKYNNPQQISPLPIGMQSTVWEPQTVHTHHHNLHYRLHKPSSVNHKADDFRFAQWEAALVKFRWKRKERRFKKKVRYEKRKNAAAQSARHRGQFVKQAGTDPADLFLK